MNHPFSTAGALRFGWEKTRANSGLLFKVVLAFAAVVIAQSIAQTLISNQIIAVLAACIIGIVEIVFGVGATVISLKLARGEQTILRDIVPPWRITVRYVLASLVSGLYIVLGAGIPISLGALIVLTYPSLGSGGLVGVFLLMALGVSIGVYLLLRYLMVKIAAVDGEIGVFDTLRKSTRLSRGVKWPLLWFLLALVLLNIIGALLFFVGLLITVPVTLVAFAHAYLALSEHSGEEVIE